MVDSWQKYRLHKSFWQCKSWMVRNSFKELMWKIRTFFFMSSFLTVSSRVLSFKVSNSYTSGTHNQPKNSCVTVTPPAASKLTPSSPNATSLVAWNHWDKNWLLQFWLHLGLKEWSLKPPVSSENLKSLVSCNPAGCMHLGWKESTLANVFLAWWRYLSTWVHLIFVVNPIKIFRVQRRRRLLVWPHQPRWSHLQWPVLHRSTKVGWWDGLRVGFGNPQGTGRSVK